MRRMIGQGQKIAVIGAGIAGLSAAWLLGQGHEVVLIEADDRLGGHANTVRVPDGAGGEIAVDTGFIVYNERTYPNFVALLDHLAVETQPTEMSFAVSLEGRTMPQARIRRRMPQPNRNMTTIAPIKLPMKPAA